MALLPLLLNSSSSFSDDLEILVLPLVCIFLEDLTFLEKNREHDLVNGRNARQEINV